MKTFIRCILIYVCLTFSIRVNAQTDSIITCSVCCCSSDPTPAGIMISHIHKKNEWMISYRYMYMGMNKILEGKYYVDDEYVFNYYIMSPQRMHMHMHMIMGMYGLSDKITLMAMMNVISNTMYMNMYSNMSHTQRIMHAGHDHQNDMHHDDMAMKSSGISDTKLHVLYGAVDNSLHLLVFSMGINLPTGKIHLKGDGKHVYSTEQRLPYMMQTGSGTWDVMPAVNYLYRKNKLSLSTQISATIRTRSNSVGYRFGHEAIFNNWASWHFFPAFNISTRCETSLSGSIKGKDPTLYTIYEPAANPANYGGFRLNTYVGYGIHFAKYIRLAVEYGMPLYQNLNGIQSAGKHLFFTSLSATF